MALINKRLITSLLSICHSSSIEDKSFITGCFSLTDIVVAVIVNNIRYCIYKKVSVLLKLGHANVTDIAEHSGVHRTNIYSILDKLKEKGLASYFTEDNKTLFKITDTENLLNYIKESEEAVTSLIPNLKEIQESVSEKISVEIFKGKSGMKSAFKDIIRERKEVVGFGMAGQLREHLPIFAMQWLRDIKHNKIKNKYIYAKGTSIEHKDFEIKILPKEFITPVATQIYNDKVLITIWEPTLIAIIIKSKEVAENYKRYFELLWKLGKIK